MTITKRGLSLLLCLVMLLSTVPVTRAQAANEPEASVDSGAVTVESTNSVGNLLSKELQAYQEADEAAGGYNVVGLTVENGVATARFRTLEPAILVVGIYTEDGLQMLTSGKAEVWPEDTEISIVLENIPEYFTAKAYLVDSYDYSPLCAAYESPLYTRQMQELLASTAADYDPERVLKLDDSETTNFAVYTASTIIIEPRDGVNTVAMADDVTSTYVIENADNQITGLQTGDIFVLPYGESNLLIVKVSTISLSGTTATVTGAQVELEEVFAYAKLEATGNASDAVVNEDSVEEGVVYDGISQTPATRAFEGDGKGEYQFNFRFVNKELKDDSENLSGKVVLNGSLSLQMELSYNYYISLSTQFTELKFDFSIGTVFSVEGKATGKLGLPDISVGVLGLRVDFQPELQLEFSGKMEYKAYYKFTKGISYSSQTGTKDLSTAIVTDTDFKAGGSVFFGINMSPVARILEGLVITELELPVGFELKVTPEFGPTQGDTIHSCKECTAMELFFKTELSAKIKFLNCEKLVQEIKVTPIHIKLCDFYSSGDYGSAGAGKCPYKSYRVSAVTEGADVDVYAGGQLLGTTDETGMTSGYLSAGTYTFCAGQYTRNLDIDRPCRVVLNVDSEIFSMIDPDAVTDVGILASGTFGLNQSWKLYHNGVMVVSGTGSMPDWLYSSSTPWYKYKGSVKTVILEEGLTSVGPNAFSGCSKLTRIVFPDSMAQIMDSAFSGCTSLTEVTIGKNVTDIGNNAFWGCTKLQSVVFPDSLYLIAKYAFQNCSALQEVTIPASVCYIYDYAFQNCTGLKSLNILECSTGQLRIYNRAFQDCTGLTTLVLPHTIKNLGAYVFYRCTGVTEIYFEGNVMAIDGTTFTRVKATVYYPAGNTSWQEIYRKNYGGTLTWVAYDYSATKKPATKAVFGGEYDYQDTYKTASFSGLMAGQEYLLLSMIDLEAEERLAPSNLLTVAQGQASEDGSLVFTYVQRVDTPVSYVIACGPSNKNLEDAVISFPLMDSCDQPQAVLPTVTYDGAVLTEGLDYVLVGSVTYTQAGTYTCSIRGINNYTGFVECSYTVEGIETFDIGVSRMILGNSLEFQFGVKKANFTTTEGYYAIVEKEWADGTTTQITVPAAEWIGAGKYWAIPYDTLAAKEMADDFHVVIYNAEGTAVSNVYTDSVRAYVMRNIDKQNQSCKTLMVDMMNYGACAQVNFKYGTDDLANSLLSDSQKAWATAEMAAVTNNQVKGTNFLGTRLVLESRIQLQLAFKSLTSDMYAIYSFTDNQGQLQEVRVKGTDFIDATSAYVVEASALVCADARAVVTFTVYNADGTVYGTAKDSIEGYAARNKNATTEALMKFTDSAKAYLYG